MGVLGFKLRDDFLTYLLNLSRRKNEVLFKAFKERGCGLYYILPPPIYTFHETVATGNLFTSLLRSDSGLFISGSGCPRIICASHIPFYCYGPAEVYYSSFHDVFDGYGEQTTMKCRFILCHFYYFDHSHL